jgi:hypothetical protein
MKTCRLLTLLLQGWHHHHLLSPPPLSSLKDTPASRHRRSAWRYPPRPIGDDADSWLQSCHLP